jgi:hypothetical protein
MGSQEQRPNASSGKAAARIREPSLDRLTDGRRKFGIFSASSFTVNQEDQNAW